MRWRALGFRLIPGLVALAALEGAMRAAGLPGFDACWIAREEFRLPDPELGYAFAPGTEFGRSVVNQAGTRGPVLSAPKPNGHFRILFVGDSTCWGQGVALEETFAARATAAWAEALPDRTVEYAIVARPGDSSYHSRVLLARHLDLEPDLVVFYVGAHNDHSRARYYPDGDIARRFARRSAAWHRVRVLQAGEALLDLSYRKWWRKLRSEEARARVPPDAFRANMDAMLSAVSGAGGRSVVLVPPASQTLLDDHTIIPLYWEALEAVARQHRAPVVVLQDVFLSHQPETVYLPDRFHFRALGHRITAEALVSAIGERL